ncbi:MAG: 23S rRNA (guanosine(2251)-2'-O)-methyltransferase RlmB [Candidatus Faecenecus gallistercoris]|nr:23S rRNA (guanosine(2251)-2'-O)-methyltransferase RlmB [Bacillota bacterium]MDD7101861.1 23S rRNA (guanosine(2251)-2'-O)-methyltransferase RlmB [Bacillota bacterium]MDY4051406.1 23S rRNA (guanosine(2251)-2'-O)-methyltransferase RlmB [Candidatus Faecenecus gallistercoris]
MLVYGKNVAIEYLQKNKKIKKIWIQDSFNDQTILSLIQKRQIGYKKCPKIELDRLANGVHQGIILEVEDYQYASLSDFLKNTNDGFLIILDHIEDPHNLGAIIRTCEAAGVDGIILPKDRSATVNATVLKTSVGTTENVKIAQVTNLVQAIQELKESGYWIVGTDMTNSTDYRKIDYTGKTAIIIGNEGSGMSRLVRESCDFIARIPMYGKVNSLNASVSAGIMIYEVLRQKNK